MEEPQKKNGVHLYRDTRPLYSWRASTALRCAQSTQAVLEGSYAVF